MAKYVTRTGKSTECKVLIADAQEMSFTRTILTVNGVYKDCATKDGDLWAAISAHPSLTKTQAVLMIESYTVKTEKRKMLTSDWLKYSVPCDGTEKPEDVAEDSAE